MKTLVLQVQIEFDSHLYDDDMIKEVVEDVYNTIYYTIEAGQITPVDSDVRITSIEVSEPFTQITFKKKLL